MMKEEGKEGESCSSSSSSPSLYTLKPIGFCNEDILFCIDVDLESQIEMKIPNPNGRAVTRMDAIKQAILLFINAKLAINPDHRFGFAALGQYASMHRRDFSNNVESAFSVLKAFTASASFGQADLTQLFRIAAHEAKKSRAQNRILRVIFIYCRSSLRPHYQWSANQKLFTLDVIYLHDKPSPKNCPQKVYDALVDALEHVSEEEGYILESGQGLSRVLFRQMCLLLAHPQQRCVQEDIDFPKSLIKKAPTVDSTLSEDSVLIISQ
ncbi:hypothetical protein AQUCO_04200050v1 [Aquilegia coerulea]|uniref:BRISC and BRCA1-A complex member 1 n=1 Tax=Aquilegia coerulea TaxID=218851 RepID=A0A2G5CP22_AQUCA|nr:hypothetical protein AQUCO_04200050v1 [Aquilegia coerulea]